MAKNPKPPSASAGKRPRGRPPKPGGRIPQAEVQRAYRARLAAAGKVVRVIDAAGTTALTNPPGATVPGFDPETQGIYDRAMVEDLRDRLGNALSKLQLQEEEMARLSQRNAYLKRELKLQEQQITIGLKEIVTLKQQLAKR